jgi:hydrogenase nickel incorporation protein HypA/HybF
MHEWALAEGVIATALEAGEKQGLGTITRIVVRIGELQRIQKEVFRQALEAVTPESEPRLAAAEIVLEIQPARFRCRPCQHRYTLADTGPELDHESLESIHFIPELAHIFMECPSCRSPDFEVVEGRGVWIEALEGS